MLSQYLHSSFLWNDSIEWIYHILFIHSRVDGHLGLHCLAIMNSAAMNIHV